MVARVCKMFNIITSDDTIWVNKNNCEFKLRIFKGKIWQIQVVRRIQDSKEG
jgi:hypothetical protein